MQTDTAIIVLNRNGRRHLEECFSSLLAQSCAPLKLYLLDNASTDGSKEFIKERFPAVKILAMDRGYGFAGGFNRGVALIKEEFIGLISNDTRVDTRWAEELRSAMDTDIKIAIAGGKLFLYDKPDTINSAGQKISPVGIGFDIGLGMRDAAYEDSAGEIGSLCGAALMVRKTLFEGIGGFDEDYFLLSEDTDLCWRARIAGYKVFYQPKAVVWHKYGATIGRRETPLRVYYLQRNSLASVIKNADDFHLVPMLAGSLLYACARTFLQLFKGNPSLLKSQLAAFAGITAMIPDLLRKRRRIQNTRAFSDAELHRHGVYASWKETIREYLRLERLGFKD